MREGCHFVPVHRFVVELGRSRPAGYTERVLEAIWRALQAQRSDFPAPKAEPHVQGEKMRHVGELPQIQSFVALRPIDSATLPCRSRSRSSQSRSTWPRKTASGATHPPFYSRGPRCARRASSFDLRRKM